MAAYEGTTLAVRPSQVNPLGPVSSGVAPLLHAPDDQFGQLPCFPVQRKEMLHAVIEVQVGGRVFHLTHKWQTPSAAFFNTQEKWIVYVGLRGKVGAFFPTKHIVLSRNPRLRALNSAMNAIDGFRKTAKRLASGK